MRLADPTTISGTELKKSTATRRRIMEAAIDCLAETGYIGTTTTTVSDRAGLTRAAMLYHFPSRMSLIEAVIHYVARERIQIYRDALTALSPEKLREGGQIDIYWEQVQGRVFKAFDELRTAARTDPDLAVTFNPAMAEFDRARRQTALNLFPENVVNKPYFDLRRDVTRYLLEGLGGLDAPAFNSERRIGDIIAFLKVLATEPEGEALLMKAMRRASRPKV